MRKACQLSDKTNFTITSEPQIISILFFNNSILIKHMRFQNPRLMLAPKLNFIEIHSNAFYSSIKFHLNP